MKFLITIVLALVSSQSFASSAVQYNCLGKDAVSGNSIFLEVDFGDYGPEVGYTNQSITIVKNGDENA